jgi:hypothetical protein
MRQMEEKCQERMKKEKFAPLLYPDLAVTYHACHGTLAT